MLLFLFFFSWLRSVNGRGFFVEFYFARALKSNYNKFEKKVQQRAELDYYNICFFYYSLLDYIPGLEFPNISIWAWLESKREVNKAEE